MASVHLVESLPPPPLLFRVLRLTVRDPIASVGIVEHFPQAFALRRFFARRIGAGLGVAAPGQDGPTLWIGTTSFVVHLCTVK
jgi:hypothetical protein